MRNTANTKHGSESGEALLAKIEALLQIAISQKKYDEVARLAKMAEETKLLEDEERRIAVRRRKLAADLQGPAHVDANAFEELDSGEPSARERGKRVRNQFVEGVLAGEGIELVRLAAKKYRTRGERLVGITYAKELDARPDSWFSGLADESYDFLILLCESATEQIAAFVLPPDVVKRIWNALSRSHGQVKFHISKTATTYELRLPGSRILRLNEYLNAINVLKGA